MSKQFDIKNTNNYTTVIIDIPNHSDNIATARTKDEWPFKNGVKQSDVTESSTSGQVFKNGYSRVQWHSLVCSIRGRASNDFVKDAVLNRTFLSRARDESSAVRRRAREASQVLRVRMIKRGLTRPFTSEPSLIRNTGCQDQSRMDMP